jgi:hypothetical protein
MFDLSSFQVGVDSGNLAIALTYADGTSANISLNSLNHSWQTLSSFTSPTAHVTQVVLTSDNFGLFQNLNIINVRAIPPVPVVSDANIAITSSPTGLAGTYKIGDTVTATWANAAGSEVDSVTMDFGAFGGSSPVVATNSGGTWTASYIITSGSIDASNRNVTVTANNAGGHTSAADSSNLKVDNQAPTVTTAKITLTGGSGTSGAFRAGDTVTATWNNTAGGDNNSDTMSAVTVDFSGFGGGSAVTMTNSGGSWTATYTIVAGSTDATSKHVTVTATDNAGNRTQTDSGNVTLDNHAPAAPSTPAMSASTDTGASSSDGITSNTTPTFTGTAESGATVTLYDTDGTTVLGTATATGGNWSITASNMSAGSHTLTAKATDTAGNVSAASSGRVINIDTSAPSGVALASTNASETAATANATLTTFSATDSNAIVYSLAAGNGTNDLDNSRFSISGTSLKVGASNLTAGTYHIYVAATDAAGNIANQAFTITVTSGPSVTSIVRTGSASGTVAGTAANISYTVTFSSAVTGVDASDFTLSATGNASASIGSVTSTDGGVTYTVTLNTLTGDGTLRLDLKSSGTGIVDGGSAPVTGGYTAGQLYTLDHSAPGLPSTPSLSAASDSGTSNSDHVTNVTTPTFTGTAEANSTVKLYDSDGTTLLGSTTADGSGNWSITTSTLIAGLHQVQATATDAAGNVSNLSTQSDLIVDTTAPTVAITSNVSSLKVGETATITFTFSEDPGNTFTWDGTTGDVTVTGGTLSAISGSGTTRTATFTPYGGVNSGTASITVAAGSYTDTAGNTGGAGTTPSLTYDTLRPNAPAMSLSAASDSGSSSSDLITNVTTPTFTGTAEVGATVTLYDTDGTTVVGSTTSDGAGNWSITTSTLSEGAHTVRGKTTDAAGNVSSSTSTVTLTILTTVPTLTVDTIALSSDTGTSGSDFITRTAAQTISGSLSSNLSAGQSVQVSLDNGSTWQSATASVGSSLWSFNATLSGSDTLKVRVVDTAGNAGPALSQAYTLDTTAPSVNSVSVPANGNYLPGQSMDFTVNFNEAVLVDTTGGIPRIALTLDTGGTVYASYVSGTGTSSMVFRYVVTDTVRDYTGVTVGALSANGGTFRDAAGNDASVTLNSVGSTAAVNVEGMPARITDVSSNNASGVYKAGDTVSITLTYDRNVTVDTAGGSPTLALNNGATASYAGGSGTNTLVFSFTVRSGQDVPALEVASPGAMALNGATINDAGGVHATALTALTAPGSASALSGHKSIAINTAVLAPDVPPNPVLSREPMIVPKAPPPVTVINFAAPDAVPSVPSFSPTPVLTLVNMPLSSLGETVRTNDTLTQGNGFHVSVMPAAIGSGDGLVLNHGMRDQAVASASHSEFTVPADAFGHSNPSASIQLIAQQSNGQPLPNWIRFDAATGKFIIDAPAGVNVNLSIRLVARDNIGREVATVFRVNVGAKSAQATQALPQEAGRSTLSEQIRLAAQSQESGAMARLARMFEAISWTRS